MVLETNRLILRSWRESDSADLFKFAKDPLVGPIAGWPPHKSEENSLKVIREVLSIKETYAIFLKREIRVIGSIGLKIGKISELGIQPNDAEIGYWIGVPYWGQGLIPEAVREIIKYGFENLKLKTLWCGYYEGNERSRRVQEKCGFVYHHTSKDVYVPLMDETRIRHVTRLTREQWEPQDSI